MKKFFILFFICINSFIFSQNDVIKSIHQEGFEYYNSKNISEEEFREYNQNYISTNKKSSKTCNLNKVVFGWHPYWMSGYEANYDWNLLSDFCYFSYVVDPATGNATTTNNWENSAAVTTALSQGVRVSLCVTLFSDHSTFFGNTTAQQTLITNLISLIQSRGAHGVNVDFEGVAVANKTAFMNFLINLSIQMHNANPNYILSVCTYAVDWNNLFDENLIDQYIDYYTIMGYDYYWSGSSIAGPVAPLYTLNAFDYNLSKTICYYIAQGASREKIVLGVPYYGREWNTDVATIPANTISEEATRTYSTVKNNNSGNYSTRLYDSVSVCPYYTYFSSNWRQCFIDDEVSLGVKYDIVNIYDIAGIGIWALGYDDGYSQLWDLISYKFTDCAETVCSGTFFDNGGPNHNYYNNANYFIRLHSNEESTISLQFTAFDVEAGSGSYCNYDYLEIFDGNDTTATSLGKFCNTTGSPSIFTSSGTDLTVKFISDNATTKSGFVANWSCNNVDLPTTIIQTDDWYSNDFTANFIDENITETAERFYQICYYDGQNWHANGNSGFAYDNFNEMDNWSIVNASGIWNIVDNTFVISDESAGNSQSYSLLNQDSDEFLYSFDLKLEGAGSNKRGGFHYFSDDTTENRGNGYFIYFRFPSGKLEFYKVTNDVFSQEKVVNISMTPNVFNNIKIIYNRIIGKSSVFINNQFISDWTDLNPIQNGNYVSFRSGNAIVTVDNLQIFKTRGDSVSVLVGNNGDAIYQNTNFLTPAFKIFSIIVDNNIVLQQISKIINIDWTAPLSVDFVNDGLADDIDIIGSNSEISANWATVFEENSEVTDYQFSLGTTLGGTEILDWTSSDNLNFVTVNNLNLQENVTYYFSIRAVNTVNLVSEVSSSDGFIYDGFTNSLFFPADDILIFPNPVGKDYINLSVPIESYIVIIFDESGKIVFKGENNKIINLANFTSGLYNIRIITNGRTFNKKIIVN